MRLFSLSPLSPFPRQKLEVLTGWRYFKNSFCWWEVWWKNTTPQRVINTLQKLSPEKMVENEAFLSLPLPPFPRQKLEVLTGWRYFKNSFCWWEVWWKNTTPQRVINTLQKWAQKKMVENEAFLSLSPLPPFPRQKLEVLTGWRYFKNSFCWWEVWWKNTTPQRVINTLQKMSPEKNGWKWGFSLSPPFLHFPVKS